MVVGFECLAVLFGAPLTSSRLFEMHNRAVAGGTLPLLVAVVVPSREEAVFRGWSWT